jgi:tRNA pseudouridine38-40 synthase
MEANAPIRRWALLLEYEGTAYGGSQYQENAPTVQGALERALSSLTGEPIRVALAGRTDAGVHARGQVASFLTASRRPLDAFARGTNALLPLDIAVRAVAGVSLAFDPRRQATSRWYRYLLHDGGYRPARLRHFVWHTGQTLDDGAMATAASALCGRHDFRAFTAPSHAGQRPAERQVFRAELRRIGKLLVFDIEADAFLPHMVRRIMGALVEIGRRKRQTGDIEALLREGQPGEAGLTAPAQGLCLMKVRYQNGLFDDETDEDI